MSLQAHPLSTWIWMLLSVQISVEAHGGYDLPFSVDKFAPYVGLGGAEHHDLHHQYPKTNFQPFFTYMDKLLDTDAKTWLKKKKLH